VSTIRTLRLLEIIVVPNCFADLVPCPCGCWNEGDEDDSDESSDDSSDDNSDDNYDSGDNTDVEGGEERESPNALANAVFRRAAEKVFETLVPNCPAFVALLFRVRNIRHASGSPDYGSAFILSTAGDQSGRAAYEAVPVEPHMLNDYGFYSGTFEVNGMRITTDADVLGRMNCRS
jgi:hypothetical protein